MTTFKKVYSVRRMDIFSGMVVRANTHQQAAAKVMKYRTMEGASEVEVREFCGGPGSSFPVMIATDND